MMECKGYAGHGPFDDEADIFHGEVFKREVKKYEEKKETCF